jgi:hypothetical protein
VGWRELAENRRSCTYKLSVSVYRESHFSQRRREVGHATRFSLAVGAPRRGQPRRLSLHGIRWVRGGYCAGGTYSLGLAEPSPKKNISSCLTMTS